MELKENLDNYDSAYKASFKYNDENSWFLSRYAKYMSESITVNDYKSILSLGIGHNIVSDALSAHLKENVTKYDILEGSSSLIENYAILDEYKSKLNLILTYFEDFETSEKYDVIEMGFVLEHVDDPQFIINKFKSFLSPNGRMFISVPNATSLHRQIGFEAGLLEDLYKLSEYDKELGHKRYFDTKMLTDMVLNSGLSIENTVGLLLKPITAEQMKTLGWGENIVSALIKLGETNPELGNCILIEAKL